MSEYFTRLRSNVKGREIDLPLGQLNAVVGDNRSGKTAVTDSVLLALTGRHPIGPHGSDLLELAPVGASQLYAELSNENETALCLVQIEKGKAKKPQHELTGGKLIMLTTEQREQLLPMHSVRELLALGTAKAREAVLHRFGDTASGTLLPLGLPPASRATWDAGLQECSPGLSTVAKLAQLVAYFRGKKLEVGRARKPLERRIDELQTTLSLLPGAEMLPELERQYQAALRHASRSGARIELETAQHDLAAYKERLEQHESTRVEVEAVEAEALKARDEKVVSDLHESQAEALWRRLARLDLLIELCRDAAAANSSCPVCNTATDMKVHLKELEDLAAQRRAVLAQYTAAKQEHAKRIAAAESTAQTRRVQFEQKLASLRQSVESGAAHIVSLQRVLADDSTPPAASAAELAITLNQVRDADMKRKQLSELSTQLHTLDHQSVEFKMLEGLAQDMAQKTLAQVALTAETAVNKYMPEGFVACLDIQDDSCQWTVRDQTGVARSWAAMCGAERATLLVAVALAWSDGAPFRVLILDDEDVGPFHSTPSNLQKLLSVLETAVVVGHLNQAFVVGLRESEVPERWHKIQR